MVDRPGVADTPYELGLEAEAPHWNGPAGGRLALDVDDRLPWLESVDDLDDEGGLDTGRIIASVAVGLLAVAALALAVWFFAIRGRGDTPVPDGSIVAAPAEPYKVKPENPGGKVFQGTGDTSFVVSEGQTRAAQLDDGGDLAPRPSIDIAPAAEPARPAPSASAKAAPAPEPSGVGVQVGAYRDTATAEAGWSSLAQRSERLSGVRHRIVEGQADIGTVYRLQAVTADLAAANALCASLRSEGIACQVKR